MKNLNMNTSIQELRLRILEHNEIDQLLIYSGTRFSIVYAWLDGFEDVRLDHNQVNFTLLDVQGWLILK